MKRAQICFLFLFGSFFSAAFGQFEIGHTTITFNDPSRTGGFGSGGGPGRQIQTEIYYPADVAGDNVAVANGEFPIIVFGHGFAMSWDAYDNIWDALVIEGYILAFPRTEGTLFPSPSHSDFALDLALVEVKLSDLNVQSTSLFYNHISDKSALMGHSMGGGCSFLAASNNTSINTVIGFAPAETTPSAISSANNVTVPALIFSADQDLVTPAADHHLPIYNALSSSCKYYINIEGGAHCYYANPNFNCDFGESTSGGSISISREEQQAIMFTYLIPWLEMYLYDVCRKNVFESDLAADSEVTYQSFCSAMPPPNYDLSILENLGTLSVAETGSEYQWVDCLAGYSLISSADEQSFTPTVLGDYAVIVGTGVCADTSACHTLTMLDITPDFSIEKEVVKIFDVTGREVPFQHNTVLFFLYTDGTIQKVYVVDL